VKWRHEFECATGFDGNPSSNGPPKPARYSVALADEDGLLSVGVTGDTIYGTRGGMRARLTRAEVVELHLALGHWLSRSP
jgi:hypothetical protein